MKQPKVVRDFGKTLLYLPGLFIVLYIWTALYGGLTDLGVDARHSESRQIVHVLGLALYSYAQDHQGHYPEGKSSTEIFQQLIDGGYISDARLLYRPMPGKVETTGAQLKAENVSYDVTCCIDSSASTSLPVVFLTGYKITYQAGAAAKPLSPYQGRTWSQWLFNDPFWKPFIVAYYVDNTARDITANADGSIPNFIPADFDPKGKTYRQLTP